MPQTIAFHTPLRLISLLPLIVLLAALGCAEEKSAEERIRSADEFLERGDYGAATIELKNAVRQAPDNAVARLMLGKVHLAYGDIPSAVKELRRARELGADDVEVLPPLAQALALLGAFEELDALDTGQLFGPQHATVLAARALAVMAQGDDEKALEEIDWALEQDPENQYAMEIKARIYFATAQYKPMRKQLEALLALDDSNATAWLLLGGLEEAENNADEAEAAYARAIELAPNPLEAKLRRAFSRIEREDHDGAQRDVDDLMAAAPNDPGINYAQGIIHFQRQNMQDAISAFAIAERDKGRYPAALLYAGIAHFTLDNLDQAAEYASQYHQLAPGDVAGRRLLAALKLNQGEFEQAEEIIRPVASGGSRDVAAMNLLANALIAQGKADEAITTLDRAASLDPDSAAAQVRLGASLLMQGQSGVGMEKLQAAIDLDPQFGQAEVLMVLNHVRQGDLDKAIEAAQAYQAQFPTEAAPLNLLGRVYRSAGRDEDARATFQSALELSGGNTEAQLNLAEMAMQRGDFARAQSHFESVLSHDPNNLAAMLKLAELASLRGDRQRMLKTLEQTVQLHPGSVRARIVLAQAYLAMQRPEQVALAFSALDDTEKAIPVVLEVTARAELTLGQYASARYNLERLDAAGSDLVELNYLKAMAAAGLGDLKAVRAELEKSVELHPDYIPARLALARFYLKNSAPFLAVAQKDALVALAPNSPDVLLLQSSLAEMQGDVEAALNYSERAFEVAPNTGTVVNLARKYLQLNRLPDAVELQESWVRAHPGDVATRQFLAGLYRRAQREDKAIDQYRQILARDEENVIALNNLAWYSLLTDPKKALGYAKRAAELSPGSAAALDTLGLAYYHSGDFSMARRTLRRALDASPEEPSIRYHEAMASAADGDELSARQALLRLLASGREFPEKADAQALLDTLM